MLISHVENIQFLWTNQMPLINAANCVTDFQMTS